MYCSSFILYFITITFYKRHLLASSFECYYNKLGEDRRWALSKLECPTFEPGIAKGCISILQGLWANGVSRNCNDLPIKILERIGISKQGCLKLPRGLSGGKDMYDSTICFCSSDKCNSNCSAINCKDFQGYCIMNGKNETNVPRPGSQSCDMECKDRDESMKPPRPDKPEFGPTTFASVVLRRNVRKWANDTKGISRRIKI